MTQKYILQGHEPIPCDDLLTWALWFGQIDARRVAETLQGETAVSTVFLGLDHNFSDHGPPLLFETMVFEGRKARQCERYATWDEAQAGHDRMVRQVWAVKTRA